MHTSTTENTTYKWDKFFRSARIVVIIFFILMLGISIFRYANYLQGQSCAVLLMKTANEEYENFDGSYTALVEKMYNDLNPVKSSFTVNGTNFDNYDVYYSAADADEALGDALEDMGYSCYDGSYYLEHRGFLGYFAFTIDACIDGGILCISYLLAIGLLLALIISNLIYVQKRKL